MSDQDQLEPLALAIATDHLLRGKSLRELASIYAASPSTLHRRLASWKKEGRFELLDRRMFSAHVGQQDGPLQEELARKTDVWRARVVSIEGVELASTEDYLRDPSTSAAISAFRASDELHRALGGVAAELFLGSLNRHSYIAAASGRGVGFTIAALEEVAARNPSWVRGFESTRIESLCGGGNVGTWATTVTRSLDADQNAFALANILGLNGGHVEFMGGWIASRSTHRRERRHGIDVAILGLGQVNTRHHFFQHHQEVHLGAMAEPLARIRRLQQEDKSLLSSVAEIAHNLFLVGKGPFPKELVAAIEEVNEVTLTVSPDRLRNAGEVILVAGGSQKIDTLRELLTGNCPTAPVDPSRVTLVTDAVTATGILAKLAKRE
jgi:DNA-binding transcriptional regulator LsrR (DeoR family)